MSKVNIAGLSLGGGRRDQFFFCLLEYYENKDRWFLKSILQVEEGDGNVVLNKWIQDFAVRDLVVDFPLSHPPCHHCHLVCPGTPACPVEEVVAARGRMKELLESEETLSKSFKRKLKRDFLPYWNRPVDVWVWEHYYDQLLDYFNMGFDSFGNTSMMLLSRFAYLKRHLPQDLAYYETSPLICLLELLRGGIISHDQVARLKDMELGAAMRMEIIQAIERELKIFIYHHDLYLMTKNPRAFASFLLGLAGQRIAMNKTLSIPPWSHEQAPHFIVPTFS